MEMFGQFKTVLKNASYLTVFEVMRIIMPFIALPYLIRTVGKENYGTVVFVQSVVMFFSLIINFGLDVSAVKDVSQNRDDKDRLNAIVSAVSVIKLALFVFALLLLTICVSLVPSFDSLRLIFYFAFLTYISDLLLPVWYFQGRENMKMLTIFRSISIMFYTVAIFIFIRSENDYPYIALLQSLGMVLASVLSFFYIIRRDGIRFVAPSMASVRQMFKESSPFFMSRVSLTINMYMAKIMSYYFLSASAVSAFDVAQKIVNGGMVPMQMFSQALYPNISKSQHKGVLRNSIRMMTLMSLIVAVVVFLFADFAVRLLSGGTMPEAAVVLRILCFFLFLSGISVSLGTSALVAFGYQKPYNMSIVWATVVLLLCYVSMVLTDNSSIYMYAMATVLAEMMVLGVRTFYCRKYGLLAAK